MCFVNAKLKVNFIMECNLATRNKFLRCKQYIFVMLYLYIRKVTCIFKYHITKKV